MAATKYRCVLLLSAHEGGAVYGVVGPFKSKPDAEQFATEKVDPIHHSEVYQLIAPHELQPQAGGTK